MLTVDPSWSVVFDAGICLAILWLMFALSRRRGFRALGAPVLLGAGAVLCVPVIALGKLFSLATSLIVVPWLAIEAYNDTEQPLPRRARALLTAARIIVFLIVILCLLRPRLTYKSTDIHRACAVVLADISMSLERQDCEPKIIRGKPLISRYEALKQILRRNSNAIEKIEEKYDYRFATFAETFARADELPRAPTGARTRIADAFTGVMRDLGGAKAAGVVLLSDGRDNGQADAVSAAARLGVPVFAVCLANRPKEGEAAEDAGASTPPDPSIQNVDCPESVFLKNVAPVVVRVAYDGPPTDELIEVRLTEDGKPVKSESITMPDPGTTVDVRLDYVPETKGLKKLVVTLRPAGLDSNARNNTKEVFVRVSESALEVLFVEGEVRWEYKFLRRAIAGARNIKLTCVNAFLAGEAAKLMLLPSPQDEKRWAELSLVILGDIPASRFTYEQLERLNKFVADGGSLLMLGGFSSLGPGGYASTPVGKLLPVDVSATDGQELEAIRVVPTEEGLEHRILELGPGDKTREIWAALPPISGYTKVSGVKPGAKVLLETPDKDPILIVQRYKKGRTAVFTADTTWRWIFNKKGEFAKYHKAFWRQQAQWLTRSGYEGAGGGIWCETDRLRYFAGDTPILTVRASGKKVENADISAIIKGPPGVKEIRMPIGKGAGQYELGLPEPVKKSGRYQVIAIAEPPATAKPGKRKKLQAKTVFVVQEPIDVETEDAEVDPKLLREIAEASGGQLFYLERASQAFKEILKRDAGTPITRSTHKRLWDNIFVYLALAGLLCVEWTIRKRRGLA